MVVGRGADYILRDYPDLVTVFIHAGLQERAERVAEFEGVSVEKASDIVIKADKKRASFYNFQTEKKWGQASGYMLSLDSGALGYDGCVELICRYLEIREKHK